ncbi:MAG: DUF5117 domain-containing protein [Planctomycetes bacterium]|nr:DUF5117 domain-containing protein [Planctomycetota bacterium]
MLAIADVTRARVHRSKWLVLLLAFFVAMPLTASADEKPKKEDKKSEKKKEKPDYKPFDEVTKGYELIEGFFPLYYNKKTDHLLAVIPSGMIGKNFLMAQSMTSGGGITGFPLGHSLVRWDQFNKKMILVEPELRHLRGKSADLKDVIDRTYTDTVLLSTPIVTKRGGDPVVDLDKILKRDFIGLGRFFGGSMDSSISKWVKRKAFKDNLELSVEAVFMAGHSGGKKAIIHYSISRLPKSDYKAREADDRVGYFLTARKDWSADHNDRTIFRRNIHRWHLRKSDPKQDVSDVHPDDQIVFYIEKTVPVQYRRYIREGIEMWNVAFEKAGIRNAIQVRQQTDTNEFANIDPEDVNYNFFRWIVSGRAFAMGPSRANPITGEILDADIIMDDAMARVWSARYDKMLGQGPTAAEDPRLHAFFEAHPKWRPTSALSRLIPSIESRVDEDDWEPRAMKILAEFHPEGLCAYASGAMHEMALGGAFFSASAGAGATREDYVGQWIKLVACHEVGHTLGLRHNFKASSWKSLEDILANTDPDVPTTASVMDYNPAVYNLDGEKRSLYMSQAVGPYDDIAIAFGYSVPSGDQKESEMLAEIAGRVAEQGLDFATDEDSSFVNADPLVNTYDNGNDPVAWAKYRMDLVDHLRSKMTEWGMKDGESYNELRKLFDMFLYESSRVTRFAARMVGGQYLHRDHKGDPNARPPVEIVDAKAQRESLAFLNERVFGASAFQFDPELLLKLAPGRWNHWDTDSFDFFQEYPIHDRISSVQSWALFHLMSPMTVRRIYDSSLKVPAGDDFLDVPELMESVASTIWSELEGSSGNKMNGKNAPLISSVRRTLQRNHLMMLEWTVMSSPGFMFPADAVAVARIVLSDLQTRINARLDAGGLDTYSEAHLRDSGTRIKRALDAGYEL